MLNTRLPLHAARKLRRDGFTLVELLVVIGIIAILAGVALGPITSGIEKAKESAGLQTVRSINLLLFTYSNDNNQTYAPGSSTANPATTGTGLGKSEGIAIQLLANGYAADPTVFAITSSAKYTGQGATNGFSDFASGNIQFDFTGGATNKTGITSTVPDQTPTCFSTGGTVSTYGPNATLNLSTAGTVNPPFKLNGAAVAYKSNSAVFIKGTITSNTAATVSGFIPATFNDTSDTFTQIVP